MSSADPIRRAARWLRDILTGLCWLMSVYVGEATAGLLGDNVTPYVKAGLTYDSNLFLLSHQSDVNSVLRVPTKWDVIMQAAVGLHGNLVAGRQKLALQAELNHRHYDHFDYLDFVGGKAGLQWQWVAGRMWSGTATYQFDRTLTGFSQFRAARRDLSATHDLGFVADWSGDSHWRWRSSANFRRLEHSLAANAISNLDLFGGGLALQYQTNNLVYTGLEATVRRADYPRRQFNADSLVDNGFTQFGGGLAIDYEVTGKSTFHARVGYTQLQQDHLSQRNFGEFTGRIGWDTAFTGHTSGRLALWREINPIDAPDLNFALDHGVSIQVVWQPTVKISVAPEFIYREYDFVSGSSLSGQASSQRHDVSRAFGLKLAYQPVKALELGLEYRTEERESTRQFFDYEFHRVLASLTLAL